MEMAVIQPRFEIKLNSKLEEVDLSFEEIDKDKLFLAQFEGEEDLVYLTINELQLSIPVDELKRAVDMLHQSKESQKGS